MNDDCRGCETLSPKGHCNNELVPHISDIDACPCINCIIKSMCSFGCEKFNEYILLNVAKSKEVNYGK